MGATGSGLDGAGDASGGGLATSGNKYVPPNLRGRTGDEAPVSSSLRDDGNQTPTLRITNLTPDTTEDEVRALCSQYGRVGRVFVAKNRETQESKGFAYVSFYRREDAERALGKLDRAGYNHVILHVDWAKPNKRDDVGSQNILSRGYVSGYGKALPQGVGLKPK